MFVKKASRIHHTAAAESQYFTAFLVIYERCQTDNQRFLSNALELRISFVVVWKSDDELDEDR